MSPLHKVVRGEALYGGDITAGDGTGGECVFIEKSFSDEHNPLKHEEPGLLSTVLLGCPTRDGATPHPPFTHPATQSPSTGLVGQREAR